MKKENFITLIFGILGGMLFGLGMCMCMLPEWGLFREGILMGTAGLVVLLILWAVRRKMQDKEPIRLNLKTVGIVVFGILGAMVFGIGMCMTMVFDGLLLQGILIGIVGILLLVCLIPLYKGLK